MKMRIFAVVMAVMCVMSCMCLTAFAAESDLPPGAQLVSNGSVIGSNDWNLDTPYVIPADDVESITIKGLFYFSHVYGWDGTQWVKITSRIGDVKDSVTFSPADYPEYNYFTVVKGDTMASQDFTVSWVEVSLIAQAGSFVSGFFTNIGGPTLGFILSHSLTLVPALAGLAILGILFVRKFVYGV